MKGVHIEPASVIKEICLDIRNLEKSQSDKVKIIESSMLLNFFFPYDFACTCKNNSLDNFMFSLVIII